VLNGLRWYKEGEESDLAFCEHEHMCEIWGSHGCVTGDISRLDCEAELLGE
jgi:hypothetical protein